MKTKSAEILSEQFVDFSSTFQLCCFLTFCFFLPAAKVGLESENKLDNDQLVCYLAFFSPIIKCEMRFFFGKLLFLPLF